MKLMIVDDERDVELLYRQRFRRELRDGTLDFVFAFSAEEALEKLRMLSPLDVVLILSDINMPGMTGLDLLRSVKSDFPQLKVCMVTAYNDEHNYQTAMTYGADDYFTKPIDFEKLKKDVLTI
ncbi:MAG: response regulator [Ignavibacteriae bacterium]|nr:response regulator [Ignavibacteria bacterium]MBI3364734.1 response regulator [Ignavibacteriota bacterium]